MFNNKDTRMLSIDVVLVSLLITLNTVNIMLGHFIFIYIYFVRRFIVFYRCTLTLKSYQRCYYPMSLLRLYCRKILSFRYWQDLGYLIIYVSSRLLFQKDQVMSWLTEHKFPFGVVSFCQHVSTDFQRHKIDFLKNLIKYVSLKTNFS